MRSWLEVRSPFFRPIWRRVAATALLAVWTLIEIAGGAVFWGVLFGAATAYLVWAFFIAFDDGPEGRPGA